MSILTATLGYPQIAKHRIGKHRIDKHRIDKHRIGKKALEAFCWEEVIPALKHRVEAAKVLREEADATIQ
ncbi:hypothetical protein [Coleofasciculus sp. FACHB-1120]|uniref:hypothetical protein n=1 Tax=Coleofasciculus sp. FACHB-1120 TaxID=2692783 RepID=UPI0016832817|nr:hypothetical protein [Coleofasciculus sp. FACHB-1120]MBD2744611.1 hypothetical protein [Coleofasciculus sp. FACHB-1120]